MPRQRRTQVIVVGGALAIASAAYGLGTQAGDGNAIAENSQNGERGARIALERGGACGFSGLADELGVDEAKLEQALRDFRSSHDDGMRDGFAADLAAALGVSEDKVSSALDKLHRKREDRFDDRMGPRDLPPPPGGARFHFGAPLRDLAKELGVTRSELRKALGEVGQKAGDRFEQNRKELARFLADRFDLDVDKVLDALPAEGPRLRSVHPPGLPDHP
jgi:Clp amino terminal domain, pathogenicity island component